MPAAPTSGLSSSKPGFTGSSTHAPKLEPQRWADPLIEGRNNCYNYALDLASADPAARPVKFWAFR